jgi:hypothetical protein
MTLPFVEDVMRDSLNAFLAAANKAQLMGHGNHKLFVQIGEDATTRLQVVSVEVYNNPMTDCNEVVIRTK